MNSEMCYAVPGKDSIIDIIRTDGLTWVLGETEAQVRERHPDLVRMPLAQFCAEKAARQNQPGKWLPVTKEYYEYALEVLPPAAIIRGAFLVGEAIDHHAQTDKPMFDCFKRTADGWWTFSRPMTHAEFCGLFGQCGYWYR